MAAQFEVRQLRLDAARKILGMAIGMCPKVGSAGGGSVQGGSRQRWPTCSPYSQLLNATHHTPLPARPYPPAPA